MLSFALVCCPLFSFPLLCSDVVVIVVDAVNVVFGVVAVVDDVVFVVAWLCLLSVLSFFFVISTHGHIHAQMQTHMYAQRQTVHDIFPTWFDTLMLSARFPFLAKTGYRREVRMDP